MKQLLLFFFVLSAVNVYGERTQETPYYISGGIEAAYVVGDKKGGIEGRVIRVRDTDGKTIHSLNVAGTSPLENESYHLLASAASLRGEVLVVLYCAKKPTAYKSERVYEILRGSCRIYSAVVGPEKESR